MQLAFGYLRISDDREGKELGVKRQGDDISALADYLGVTQRLDVYPVKNMSEESAVDKTGDAIFIVHGHALLKREEVRRFLERATSRQIVVLEDEANQGRDIFGKLLDSAKKAAYAVVLLTADDEGRAAGSSDVEFARPPERCPRTRSFPGVRAGARCTGCRVPYAGHRRG